MDKKKFIQSYIKSSERRIKYCNLALKEKDYAYIVRETQMIVELCTKALLNKYSFVVPKEHELSSELEECLELFSDDFQKNFAALKKFSKKLRRQREISVYGVPESDQVPEELYTKEVAEDYLGKTLNFLNVTKKELNDYLTD